MRRLRLLCLLLALAGVLACGARGAEVVAAARFTDWDAVSHQAEVAMLVDLGLVSGYDDGAFRPRNCVTRAEVAKIVTGLLTEAMPRAEASAFSDVAGSWAEGYISFCAARGILAGGPDGRFRPGDNITARELAKVLLAALGHRTDDYTGPAWATAVDRDAKALGLYDGYEKDLSLFITREDACMMISGALLGSVVTGYDAAGAPQYALDDMMSPKSLLEYRFEVMPVTGVVEANAVADLRAAGTALDGNRIHIAGYTRDFLVSEQVARDESLLGHRVTLYARFSPTINQVFGMPSIRAQEAALTLEDPQALQALLDHGALRLAADVGYYEAFQPVTAERLAAMTAGDTLTVIDHEGDGVADLILISKADENESSGEN